MNSTALTLIDTSAWIEALRSKGSVEITKQVDALLQSGQARFCEPVILELYNGAKGKNEILKLREMANAIPMLPTTETIWREAYASAISFRERGLTIPNMDILIYQIAKHHGARLLSVDAHFAMI